MALSQWNFFICLKKITKDFFQRDLPPELGVLLCAENPPFEKWLAKILIRKKKIFFRIRISRCVSKKSVYREKEKTKTVPTLT